MKQQAEAPKCPQHNFQPDHAQGERRTWYVLWLTAITMVVEIVAGMLFGSMALLADGWHMATHVAAFTITLFAYRYARRHADNPRFTFGTGKVSSLGGFASAVALAVVALFMAMESIERLVSPKDILFDQAIMVAVIGLTVNLVSAWLLMGAGHHDHHHHHHEDAHEHAHSEHTHHDHNLRAAYLHVLADALTSITAIAALLAGKWMGWHWMDPLMGIVGALVITHWALGLFKQTSEVLLDQSPSPQRKQAMIDVLHQVDDTQVTDFHLWQISPNHYAAVISLTSGTHQDSDIYRKKLSSFDEVKHLTIEISVSSQ